MDHELAIPQAFGDDVRRLVAEDYSAHMFYDETKRAMVSVEQHIAVANPDYRAEQELFDADAMDLMARHGLGVVRLDHHAPDSDDQIDYRVDPTIISTDIESVRLGKDLGASRAVEFLAAQGITPQAWRTVGDSRTDYAMADWLHHNDHAVKHVDVRPADGVPVKPYEVLTAADLGLGEDVIHDDAGAAFLRQLAGRPHRLRPAAAARPYAPRRTARRPVFRGSFEAGVIMQVGHHTHSKQHGESDITEATVQDEIYYGSQASEDAHARKSRRRPLSRDSGPAPTLSAAAAGMR